jgi:diguanylate cyclase (GGDEF)-like protein/PAS domain S-box-containing protein
MPAEPVEGPPIPRACGLCGRPAGWVRFVLHEPALGLGSVSADEVCEVHRAEPPSGDPGCTVTIPLTEASAGEGTGPTSTRAQPEDVLAAVAVRTAPGAAMLTESRGHLLFVNSAWSDLTGQELEAARGLRWLQVLDAAGAEHLRQAFRQPPDGDIHELSFETKAGFGNDEARWIQIEARALRREGVGSAAWAIGFTDITELKASIEQLQDSQTHDAVTGSLNRVALMDHTRWALARQTRSDARTTAFCIEIEGIDGVASEHGTGLRDDVLKALAGRIRASLRPGDAVARYDPVAFVAICEQLQGEGPAVAIARRLVDELEEPVAVGPVRSHVETKVGVALAESRTISAEDLISRADLARYVAKERGAAYVIAGAPPPVDGRTEPHS